MRIAIISPASLPATQFGGILFVAVHIAKIAVKEKHKVTIYTTDLDFANNATTFNKNLPREEDVDNFKIKTEILLYTIIQHDGFVLLNGTDGSSTNVGNYLNWYIFQSYWQ